MLLPCRSLTVSSTVPELRRAESREHRRHRIAQWVLRLGVCRVRFPKAQEARSLWWLCCVPISQSRRVLTIRRSTLCRERFCEPRKPPPRPSKVSSVVSRTIRDVRARVRSSVPYPSPSRCV